MKMMVIGQIVLFLIIYTNFNMAVSNAQITNSGVPNKSGLEVYMTVTISSVEYLIPIVAEDRNGNAHKVLRRDLNNTISD